MGLGHKSENVRETERRRFVSVDTLLFESVVCRGVGEARSHVRNGNGTCSVGKIALVLTVFFFVSLSFYVDIFFGR
jgi:hypothetical protein